MKELAIFGSTGSIGCSTPVSYTHLDYEVLASMGHVRDLPASRLSVDVKNDFAPNYENIKGKGELIKKLRNEAKKSDYVYLATDPDREGEAISWHLAQLLKLDETEQNLSLIHI